MATATRKPKAVDDHAAGTAELAHVIERPRSQPLSWETICDRYQHSVSPFCLGRFVTDVCEGQNGVDFFSSETPLPEPRMCGALRIAAGLSRSQLARQFSLTEASIEAIEGGWSNYHPGMFEGAVYYENGFRTEGGPGQGYRQLLRLYDAIASYVAWSGVEVVIPPTEEEVLAAEQEAERERRASDPYYELRSLASKAHNPENVSVGSVTTSLPHGWSHIPSDNAAFVRALSPAVVLSLLSALTEAQASK